MEQESEQVRIRNLLKDNPKGLTIEEVSKKLSLNRATAAKYLNSLMISGQAELRELGRAKIFYLSQRLPLTNMLSLSSDLILILDRDLFIQEANDPFLVFFNQTRDELKGKKIEHSLIAPFFSEYLPAIEKALEGTEYTIDVHLDTGEREHFFRMKLIPLVQEGGARAAGMILEDISEMKRYQRELEDGIRRRTSELIDANNALLSEVEQHRRAEVALRDNEAVLRSMLDATPVGVALLVDRVFRKVNDALCTITGYPEQELLGRNTRLLYTDDESYRKISDVLYSPWEGKGVRALETALLRKDGEVIDVIISLSPHDPRNPAAGVTATITDITESKRAEEAVRRANKQVALLTGVTRHDILNQITTLKGYIGILKKQEISGMVREILHKEEAVADTIGNLIIFTRDYKDVGTRPPEWISIADTITAAQNLLDYGSIAFRIDSGAIEIYADPLIEKVFYNLFENSIRHGGSISEISVAAEERTKDLVITVADNGTGVPREIKELIFERDYGKNTGLGLFLAREILSITGISIAETGEPGHGARFELTVPRGMYRFAHRQNPDRT